MILIKNINLSTILMMPLISEKDENYSHYVDESIPMNYYTLDVNRPWYTKNFFISISTLADKKQNFINLSSKSNYVSKYLYSISNEYRNVYVFNVDSDFEEDLKLIRMNNHMFISKLAKNRIIQFWGAENASSILTDIMTKKCSFGSFFDVEIPEIDEEEEWVDRLL